MTPPLDTPLVHGIARLQPDVRLLYAQTWWEWRHVIAPLAKAGWRVVAPDYRGAGGSSKPPEGYDKRTLAADILELLRTHLGITEPVTMVGHDIGWERWPRRSPSPRSPDAGIGSPRRTPRPS